MNYEMNDEINVNGVKYVRKEEPKQILVPDCIKIERFGNKLGIQFNANERVLYHSDNHKKWNTDWAEKDDVVDCVLIPIAVDDLENGDLVYFSSMKDPSFNLVEQYGIVEGEIIMHPTEKKGISSINVIAYTYFWKVRRVEE